LKLVQQVFAGIINQLVAIANGVASGWLYQWARKYKADSDNGPVNKKKGRKSGGTIMKTDIHLMRRFQKRQMSA
jgi:hypothetical protein